MQTNFTEEQLADPDTRLADEILRKCVHCGFCLATCPTYVIDGDERDSPRGRIYLIKDYLETGQGAQEALVHLDRCLTCGSCETTCPSGVSYLRLVDFGRMRLAQEGVRTGAKTLFRQGLARLMTRERLFRAAMQLGVWSKPFHSLLPKRLRAMTLLLPSRVQQSVRLSGVHPARGPAKFRVALHTGCVQKTLKPDINLATLRVLTKLGCEVEVISNFRCCGGLAQHLGAINEARKDMVRNVAALKDGEFDFIVSNASGCGVTLKDYGHLLRQTDTASAAEDFASRVVDVTELLGKLDLGAPLGQNQKRVAYQASCTMQHGQKIVDAPKKLLSHFGYEVLEPREPHLCCGFAGTYNIMEPERAGALRTRKAGNLKALGADVVASANIGCMTGLSGELDIPVKHVIELISEALG